VTLSWRWPPVNWAVKPCVKTRATWLIAALLPAVLLFVPAAYGNEITLSYAEAAAALTPAAEHRDGYTRTAFWHWADEDGDGCDTRAEVLQAEALIAEPAARTGGCVPSGPWFSWYDALTITSPSGLDIDHAVPLAEAWDSGAWAWDAPRRHAYANDLGDPRSLTAVSARTNRSKADQDPAQWLPPDRDAWCPYVGAWLAVKLRWQLTADEAEKAVLSDLARLCGPLAVLTVTAV
jgi:hypothetical protein